MTGLPSGGGGVAGSGLLQWKPHDNGDCLKACFSELGREKNCKRAK